MEGVREQSNMVLGGERPREKRGVRESERMEGENLLGNWRCEEMGRKGELQ